MAKKDKKAPNQEKTSASTEIAKKFKQNPGIYIGSVVILVLVIVTFLGGDLLSGGVGRQGGDLTFGEYDNVPISYIPGNMFAQFYEQIARNYQSQGYDLNDFRVGAQIWRSAFEQTVIHTAVLQMVRKSNYTVPEEAVDRAVAKLPQFQDNGRFSPVLYNRMTEASRNMLWRQTQDELAKITFFNDFFGMSTSKAEAQFIANMSSVMRSFDMISFSVEDFPDSEYMEFALNNTELFNSIHMSKITITASEREARRILASINDGTTTFEDAARVQSQDSYADRGGDMGVRYVFELDGDIPNPLDRDVVLNLKEGEISDVINAGGEWAIFRIENELIHADFDDFMVMDRVRSYVRNFARGRMEDWAIAQANVFIAEANVSGFNTVARWHNKERHNFGPLPINYAGIDLFTALESFEISGLSQQELSNLSRNENFWKVAFTTPISTPSEPLVQGDYILVFFPTEETTSDEEALENIASMYSSYWVNYMTEQSFQVYFMNNDKMNDRFWDIYIRYFM